MSRALSRAALVRAAAVAALAVAVPLLVSPAAGATTPPPTPGLRAGVAASGSLMTVYRRSDARVVLRQLTDGLYPAVDVGGNLAGSPAIVSTSPSTVDIAGIGTDGAVWTRHGTYGIEGWEWNPWTSRGGVSAGSPTLGCNLLDGPVVYVRGPDGALWRRSFTKPWASLGGSIASAPAAVSTGTGCPNAEDVVALGGDKAVWERRAGAWKKVGGASNFAPAIVRLPDGRSYVYVVGTNKSLYQAIRFGDDQPWSAFQKKSTGVFTSAPAVTDWTDAQGGGPITVVALGANGQLYRTSTNDDGSWTFVPFG